MSKVDLLNKEGTVVGDVELNDAIFARQINAPVMHQAVLVYLASQRPGTHQTKTRGEVSGTGKKPWRQKGLGRARVGGFRNPVWRGGGVAFGPHPRSYTIAMPKKMRRLALLSALSQKATEGNIVVVDELSFTAPQTKEMARILNNLSARWCRDPFGAQHSHRYRCGSRLFEHLSCFVSRQAGFDQELFGRP